MKQPGIWPFSRGFRPTCLALTALALAFYPDRAAGRPDAAEIGKRLPAWTAGELDIHHINTGRGDSIFYILPDGTTLLVDAGDGQAEPLPPPFALPTKPNSSRQGGEWIARYIADTLRAFPEKRIDYAILTHFHGDHIGKVTATSKRSPNGDYFLTGISEIPEYIPIRKIIDRDWPDYSYPAPLALENFRKFLDWQTKHRGVIVERFKPGQKDQVVLCHNAAAYPGFEVQNLIANGRVWTGEGTSSRELADVAQGQILDENQCSIAFRLSYGKFNYFNGGDLDAASDAVMGRSEPWQQVESAAAKVCGPVDVMKADHHGSWNANGAEFLRLLQPRVIVVTSRADGHPAVNTFARMVSKKLWDGPRDIFITNVTPATQATTYTVKQAKSQQGHVVIRVDQGGASYRVFVLDDSDESRRIKAVFGPYAAR